MSLSLCNRGEKLKVVAEEEEEDGNAAIGLAGSGVLPEFRSDWGS